MKTYMNYAIAAVLTLAASTFLTYHAAAAGNDEAADAALGIDGVRIAADDIARATEDAFDDFQAENLKTADQDQLMMVRPLKQDLAELGDRQKLLTDRIDAILSGELTAKKAADGEEVVIPEGDRVDTLVAQAIVKFRDDQEKERTAKRQKQREERNEKRRAETIAKLTEKLNLSSSQASEVTALMSEMEITRDDMREKMRAARANGGEFDWRSMGEEFVKIGESADGKMNAILNPDQKTAYEDYKKEDPMGSAMSGFGAGGMRGMMGGRNRGGRNR